MTTNKSTPPQHNTSEHNTTQNKTTQHNDRAFYPHFSSTLAALLQQKRKRKRKKKKTKAQKQCRKESKKQFEKNVHYPVFKKINELLHAIAEE